MTLGCVLMNDCMCLCILYVLIYAYMFVRVCLCLCACMCVYCVYAYVYVVTYKTFHLTGMVYKVLRFQNGHNVGSSNEL